MPVTCEILIVLPLGWLVPQELRWVPDNSVRVSTSEKRVQICVTPRELSLESDPEEALMLGNWSLPTFKLLPQI